MSLIDVILPVPINSTFTYESQGLNISVGDLVEVNFSGRNMVGLVVNVENDINTVEKKYKIKNVMSIIFHRAIKQKDIEFLYNVSNFNMIPIGLVFKMMFPDCLLTKNSEKVVKKYSIK